MIRYFGLLAVVASLCLAGCGGGGSSSPPTASSAVPAPTTPAIAPPAGVTPAPSGNSVPMTVSNATVGSVNTLVVSVTVCQPGSTVCATIPNVQVDTGSSGLRLASSALSAAGLTLPSEPSPTAGQSLSECAIFGSGYAWGAVSLADVHLAGEVAHSVPIQVINNAESDLPAWCTGQGIGANDLSQFGINGIMGVDAFLQDCGSQCATTAASSGYFACDGNACTQTTVPLPQQVPNPVSKFATDNNGIILSVPRLAIGYSSLVNATLVFGLDTESNNASTGVSMMNGNSNAMTATYNGTAYNNAIIDSGSGIDTITNAPLPTCQARVVTGDLYCPTASPAPQSAVFGGDDGAQMTVNFNIANAQTFNLVPFSTSAYAGLAANAEILDLPYVDLGMSFFYGHNVYLRYPVNGAPEQIGVQANALITD